MKIGFLILIGVVLICSVFFGFVIWRQTLKFEKKARLAKQRKEDYIRMLEMEREMELLAGEDPQPGEPAADPQLVKESTD